MGLTTYTGLLMFLFEKNIRTGLLDGVTLWSADTMSTNQFISEGILTGQCHALV